MQVIGNGQHYLKVITELCNGKLKYHKSEEEGPVRVGPG